MRLYSAHWILFLIDVDSNTLYNRSVLPFYHPEEYFVCTDSHTDYLLDHMSQTPSLANLPEYERHPQEPPTFTCYMKSWPYMARIYATSTSTSNVLESPQTSWVLRALYNCVKSLPIDASGIWHKLRHRHFKFRACHHFRLDFTHHIWLNSTRCFQFDFTHNFWLGYTYLNILT